MRRYEREGRGDTDWMETEMLERECLAPLHCIPHFPPQYRPTLTAKVRNVRSPPPAWGNSDIGKKASGEEGGCGGGMPTGCPARGVDHTDFGTTGKAKWQAVGSVNSFCDLYALC